MEPVLAHNRNRSPERKMLLEDTLLRKQLLRKRT
ncbi:hypothetical protein MFFC18_38750 [Mariniblastus fucicola]|uniref:Uncharacterized protein n=1 Tax=Mariniblastus fucicola TaxID=980251 RepID=A0A5B9PFK7_9BACT|nr:hypothetical protein MFFC18_38750 [Mariniblastus fucicola]